MLQRILGNTPLSLHLLLLFLSVVLRLPAFSGSFFPINEALYGTCAVKLGEGSSLYNEIWFSGPPFMIWFYGIFTSLFGGAWLWIIRVFTCLYIYITALYFGTWVASYRPFERYHFLPSVILVVLCSTPWSSLELTPEVLMLLPMMIAYRTLIKTGEAKTYTYQPYFLTGILIMLCVLTSYNFLILFLSVILLYFVIKNPAIDEVTALLGGAGVCLGIFIAALSFFGSLGGFIDLALIYGLDLLRFELFNESFKNIQVSFLGFFAVEVVFVLLAVLGFFRFRIKYFTSLVKIRRLETAMAIWLVAGLLSIFLSVSDTQLHEWLLIAPPLAFYATKAFDFHVKKWVYPLVLVGSFIPALYLYIHFWVMQARPLEKQEYPMFTNQPLLSYFKNKTAKKGIWVMEFKPEMYLALDKKCATKYIDYRIVFQKFHPLPYASTHLLISKVESDAEIFEEFQKSTPDYIIDKNNLFPKIQEMYPALFYHFKSDIIGEYKIYHP